MWSEVAQNSLFVQLMSWLTFVFYSLSLCIRYKTQPVSSPTKTPLCKAPGLESSPTHLKTPVSRRQTQPVTPEEMASVKQFIDPVKTTSSIKERWVWEEFGYTTIYPLSDNQDFNVRTRFLARMPVILILNFCFWWAKNDHFGPCIQFQPILDRHFQKWWATSKS